MGLVVSALDFRSRGRWFEPGHCRRVVSSDKKLYSTLYLFTWVYKWETAISSLGVTFTFRFFHLPATMYSEKEYKEAQIEARRLMGFWALSAEVNNLAMD